MRPTQIALLMGFITLLSSNLYAWSWNDAEQQALRAHLPLLAAEESVAISSLARKSARSRHLPDLSLVGDARRYDDQDGAAHWLSGGLRMDLPLFGGGRIGFGASAAGEKYNQAKYGRQITKVDVLKGLRTAFSQALYVKNLMLLRERIVDQRKQNLEFVKLRYDSGLEYRWVYLSSKSKFDQAKLRSLDAQLSESVALAALESILGKLPIESVTEVSEGGFFESAADYSLDFFLRDIDSHPKSLLRASQIKESEFRTKVRKAEFYPKIGFRGQLLALDQHDHDVVPFWSIGAFLDMPLFEGRRTARNLQIAKKREHQQNLEAKQLTLTLRTRIKRAHKDLVIAKERITVSRQSYEANEDRAKVVTRQYRAGIINFLHFERAQDDWVRAEESLLRTKIDYYNTRARFEAEIGRELGSS